MASPSGSHTYSLLQMDHQLAEEMDDNHRAGPSSLKDTADRQTVSRRNKGMAAIGGAAVTSLMMTPFDVIKTRLQTQTSPEPLFQPSSVSPPGTTCCQSTQIAEKPGLLCQHDPRLEPRGVGTSPAAAASRGAVNAAAQGSFVRSEGLNTSRAKILRLDPSQLSSSSGGISAISCDFPDRDVAIRELERTRNNSRMAGLWDGVMKVSRAEGVRGLWRGLTPTLAMTVPSQLTYMTCYDSFRQYFLSLDKSPIVVVSKKPSLSNVSSHTLMASLASGALSRGISATLVTPLELLRTRLQASTSANTTSGRASSLTSTISDLAGQVRSQGPSVMFRGLVPTLYRDVPFSALYFAGYETMKRIMTGSGLGERNAEDSRMKEFGVAFVSGSVSGIAAAIVTQPFDLIKTRLQAEASQTQTQAGKQQSNTMQVFRQILARDGTSGLFRGLSPRVAKVAPACGIMIASFEFVGRWLQENSSS